jgi:hypothetical protein
VGISLKSFVTFVSIHSITSSVGQCNINYSQPAALRLARSRFEPPQHTGRPGPVSNTVTEVICRGLNRRRELKANSVVKRDLNGIPWWVLLPIRRRLSRKRLGVRRMIVGLIPVRFIESSLPFRASCRSAPPKQNTQRYSCYVKYCPLLVIN